MKKIKIGIIGVTGYTGIELLEILSNHPMADIIFVGANSNFGPYINDEIPSLNLSKRLKIRKNHFFPIGLLDNQFEILENPSNAIKVNASNDIDLVCEEIYTQIL